MRVHTECPNDEELCRLLEGRLEPSRFSGLVSHFIGCEECTTRAEAISGTDTELESTIRAAQKLPSPPPIPALVLERLRRLGPQQTPPDELPSGTQIGRYILEGKIGQGGMGVVYRARHEFIRRPVALKLLPHGAPNERVARFQREAEAVAALRHPNVVQVHEVGESDGRPFLVMEFIPGETLATWLSTTLPTPEQAARLVRDVARAVGACHTLGIIHRDLKPGNILIDPPETPKVSDFGLAKFSGDNSPALFETESGAVLGTPAYMAPEQAAGRSCGPAVDIYGVGAILYECLTGRPPFIAANVFDILDQLRTRDPIPPRQIESGVPRDLETICLKCLEKSPDRRYSSPEAVADELDRFLGGEPVQARPTGAVIRILRWIKRHPTSAALAVTGVLFLITVAVVVAVYTAKLRDAADVANLHAAEAGRQRERTAGNYQMARNTVRRMLGRVQERGASEIPRLQELRRSQLEDALAFYEGVLGGLDDPDPEVQLDSARALVELAEVRRQLGQTDSAGADFHRAIEALLRLPSTLRERSDCRAGLIASYNNLADIALSAKRGEDSEAYYRKSMAEAEANAGAAPNDPVLQDVLATTEHNLGVQFQLRGQASRSEPHYQRAVAIRTDLVEHHPGVEAYRIALSEGLINLGLLHHQFSRSDEAIAAFRKADDLLRPLIDANPSEVRYALSLAGLCINWGNLIRSKGDLPGALEKYDRAVTLADVVVGREPNSVVARMRALQAHGARALAREQALRLVEALADWDRVVEYADEVARPGYQLSRALLISRAGSPVRAAAEARELVREAKLSEDNTYNLACLLASVIEPIRKDTALGALGGAAAAELCAATAIETLQRLKDRGYFLKPANAKLLATDTDLASLRHRGFFCRLMAETNGSTTPQK